MWGPAILTLLMIFNRQDFYDAFHPLAVGGYLHTEAEISTTRLVDNEDAVDFKLRDGHGQAAIGPGPVERSAVGDPGHGFGPRLGFDGQPDVFERRDEVRETVRSGRGILAVLSRWTESFPSRVVRSETSRQ